MDPPREFGTHQRVARVDGDDFVQEIEVTEDERISSFNYASKMSDASFNYTNKLSEVYSSTLFRPSRCTLIMRMVCYIVTLSIIFGGYILEFASHTEILATKAWYFTRLSDWVSLPIVFYTVLAMYIDNVSVIMRRQILVHRDRIWTVACILSVFTALFFNSLILPATLTDPNFHVQSECGDRHDEACVSYLGLALTIILHFLPFAISLIMHFVSHHQYAFRYPWMETLSATIFLMIYISWTLLSRYYSGEWPYWVYEHWEKEHNVLFILGHIFSLPMMLLCYSICFAVYHKKCLRRRNNTRWMQGVSEDISMIPTAPEFQVKTFDPGNDNEILGSGSYDLLSK